MHEKLFFLFCVALILNGVSWAQDEEPEETDSALSAEVQAKAEARGGLKSIFNWAKQRTGRHPLWRRYRLNYPRISQQNAFDVPGDLSRTESFKDFIRRLRSLRIRRPRGPKPKSQEDILQDIDGKIAITESVAEKEDLWDLFTIGKKLYKAYQAYQDGVATKEDLQSINEDIDRVIQQMNAVMAEEEDSEDDRVEEEAFFTVPALLYNAYKGYQLYKKYVG